MPRPVDERTATSIRVPGSGASTVPTATKPADVPNPNDQRSGATPRPITKEVRPEKTIDTVPPDFDFEVSNTTPRSASAEAMSTDNPPPETTQGPAGDAGERPNDIPATMKIKFRGEEREYPIETIRLLAQQSLNVSADSPVLAVIAEIKKQTGVTDPKQLANMVLSAVQRIIATQGGANGDPARAAQAAAAGGAPAAAEAANIAAQAASPALNLPPPNPNAEKEVQEFEVANGLQLPDGMRSAILNVVKYGQALEQIVGTYAGMFQQVQAFNNDMRKRSQSALSSAVNAEAARVATELGIDTPEEVQGFAKWVAETDSVYPGFKKRVTTDPKAMGRAVRDYYEQMTGRNAIAQRKEHVTKVNSDLVRAGGDMIAPRPSGGAIPREPEPGDETKDFNQDLMSRM